VAWAYVPAALPGTWCGLALFARLTDRQFAIAVATFAWPDQLVLAESWGPVPPR
jgi:hypothetical protein